MEEAKQELTTHFVKTLPDLMEKVWLELLEVCSVLAQDYTQ